MTFTPIPNSLRPDGERDDRPVIYLCYRTWEPIVKWCARMDGHAAWSFAKHRAVAIERAIIAGTGCHFEDTETVKEVKATSRIKMFEVRPPRGAGVVTVAPDHFVNHPQEITDAR